MRAAFFDLDGCLVDSREPIAEAFNAGLRAVGAKELPEHDIHPYIGPPLVFSYGSALRDLGADPGRAVEAVDGYRSAYPRLAVSKTTVIDGIPEALEQLGEELRLAVVTSKPVEYADPILRAVGLRDYFADVHGPALEALTEPKAINLEAALQAAGIPTEQRATEACMIGDRKHDIAAGVTCGTATIGVTWGIGTRVELAMAGATVIVGDPSELPDAIAGVA